MPEPLPIFVYHPDPLKTGSVIVSATVCRSCGKARDFIYIGPVYSEEDLDDCICPWCIADGSAHVRFDAEFCDQTGIGGYGFGDSVSKEVREEVAFRTPGFSGWQQERWWTHCSDAALFIGKVGYSELEFYGTQAIDAIVAECGYADSELSEYMKGLDSEGSSTAYLFKCRKCGLYGGYSDCD